VLRDTPDDRLGLPDPAGTIELRTALASYLGRVRGAQASPEHLVITSGTRHGLSLVWRALAAEGVQRVAIEDPGWSGIGETAVAAGLEPAPEPVDDGGMLIDALGDTPVDAVAVAPAHQYPTGAVLSAERRVALLNWAREGARLVIEDDYDAEYRYDHQPIGSLQGLAPERVIYAGSSSKTVAPSLRLGWLVVPARAELTVGGAAAGLYAVVSLPPALDESAVVKAARARGLALEGRGTEVPGLVLGYADIDAATIPPAVSALAASIEDARRSLRPR
jgi:GntR family transcriptional regulator/MocR family aminotransferase